MGRHRYFGNILNFQTFQDVLHTPEYRIFTEHTSEVSEQCTVCSMKDFCHNGCVAHREPQSTSAPHYAYCGSRLAFYEYLKTHTGVKHGVATPTKQVLTSVLRNKPYPLPVR
jgi:radical SAM protein with 4Fe4S-binding SPASM domain